MEAVKIIFTLFERAPHSDLCNIPSLVDIFFLQRFHEGGGDFVQK